MVKDKGCMNFWLLYYTFFMVDVQHLSQVRKLYEDHFTDKFDGLPFPETDLSCNYKFTKTSDSSDWTVWIDDVNNFQGSATKVSSIGELDPETQTIVLLSDAYGAEGELGILLSEIYGTGCILHVRCVNEWGAVAMADCFSPLPPIGLHTGLPPVIEASSALYHLLSIVDLSLHGHLVELGVEPQYFGLHWLRVLFGCEFLLEDLLIIWDERFASDNRKSAAGANDDAGFSFGALNSSCGAFISTVAVSMLLHLRSLLATEIATSSLQRLLNLKDNIVNVNKLIEKAKSLQALALNTILSTFPSPIGASDRSKSTVVRGHSLSSGWISPITPLNSVPESYWEEESLAQGRRSSA